MVYLSLYIEQPVLTTTLCLLLPVLSYAEVCALRLWGNHCLELVWNIAQYTIVQISILNGGEMGFWFQPHCLAFTLKTLKTNLMLYVEIVSSSSSRLLSKQLAFSLQYVGSRYISRIILQDINLQKSCSFQNTSSMRKIHISKFVENIMEFSFKYKIACVQCACLPICWQKYYYGGSIIYPPSTYLYSSLLPPVDNCWIETTTHTFSQIIFWLRFL